MAIDASSAGSGLGMIGTGAMMGGPVGAGIGGAAAIISAILDSQAKNAGTAQAQSGLNWQKQNADRQYRLATAGHQDAFGNEVSFNEALNKFITHLTDMQSRIVHGGEHEQLLGLTDDARMNRNVRGRAYSRGVQADDDYARARAGYQFKAPPSEGSIRDELTSLLTGSAQGEAQRATRAASSNALRTGTRQPNPRATSEDLGSMLSDILLKARTGAMAESTSRNESHNNQYLPELQALQATAMGGSDGPINLSNNAGSLNNTQDSMAKLIQAALQSGGTNVNAANKNASDLLFKSGPDMKGMASLISAISGTGTYKGKRSTPGTDTTVPIGTTGDYEPTF